MCTKIFTLTLVSSSNHSSISTTSVILGIRVYQIIDETLGEMHFSVSDSGRLRNSTVGGFFGLGQTLDGKRLDGEEELEAEAGDCGQTDL